MSEDEVDKKITEDDMEITTGDGAVYEKPKSLTERLKSLSSTGFGVVAVIAIIGYGIATMVIGYIGIEETLGAGWAMAALIAMALFKFTLPMSIGAFFGLIEVFNWHWAFALIFVMPGLLLLIPVFLMSFFTKK